MGMFDKAKDMAGDALEAAEDGLEKIDEMTGGKASAVTDAVDGLIDKAQDALGEDEDGA